MQKTPFKNNAAFFLSGLTYRLKGRMLLALGGLSIIIGLRWLMMFLHIIPTLLLFAFATLACSLIILGPLTYLYLRRHRRDGTKT